MAFWSKPILHTQIVRSIAAPIPHNGHFQHPQESVLHPRLIRSREYR
ncbi:hypothetical protein F0726_00286 [Acidithiobacillus caldus]|nr:hypothetical protein F0726_00286 [Acidithiobacillus caldus]